MKYALLVAWREYAENAKTKGFWLSLFLFPTILFLCIQVPILLEQKAAPVRYFVLVDQSKSLGAAVQAALEANYQRQVLGALKTYARNNVAPAAGGGAPTATALDAVDEGDPQSVEAFVAHGGKEALLAELAPKLRSGAPPFQEPRRRLRQAPLPAPLKPDLAFGELADALKPYLRHERRLELDGQSVELAAAILIPPNLDALVVRPRDARRGSNPEPGAPPGQPASPPRQVQYWSANASDPFAGRGIERAVNAEIRRREYEGRGLDSALVRQVEHTYVSFASLDPRKRRAARPSARPTSSANGPPAASCICSGLPSSRSCKCS